MSDDTNPKDALGASKPDLSLVPPASLIHEALAMENGANKYGPYNWRSKKVRARVYIAAAMRHLLTYLDGENTAKDSGIHHLAHAKACCGILLDALETGNLIDDRPVKGAATMLLAARETEAWKGVDREVPERATHYHARTEACSTACPLPIFGEGTVVFEPAPVSTREKEKAWRRENRKVEWPAYPCPYKCPEFYVASKEALTTHIEVFHKGGTERLPHRWIG